MRTIQLKGKIKVLSFSNTLEGTKLDGIYNESQNKVSITRFLSQILQRRPCKLSSGYPPLCSLLQDNGVSLTSHDAERNSEGGCSTP